MAYCKKGKGVDLYTCIPLHTSQTIYPRTISTPWGAIHPLLPQQLFQAKLSRNRPCLYPFTPGSRGAHLW